MRLRLTAVLLVAVGFLGVAGVSGCGGLPDNAAAARVNGHVITKDDVKIRVDLLRKKLGAMVPDESEGDFFSNFQREVTDKLVQEWLEKEETDRRGIKVTEEEIDARLQEIADESYLGSVEELMKEEALDIGLTEEELGEQVRRDLLHEKLLQDVGKDIVVTDEDARDYYQRNVAQYVQPERRQVRQIITDSESSATVAVSRIRAGESFISLVDQVSIDPLAQQKKGALNLISPGQLAPGLDKVVYSLPIGQVSDPIRLGEQWYILLVENIVPPVDNPFEEVKDEIKGLYGNQIFSERYRALVVEVYENAEKDFDPQYDMAGKMDTDVPAGTQGGLIPQEAPPVTP